jgi:branched-chain amino acid transport system permease protein
MRMILGMAVAALAVVGLAFLGTRADEYGLSLLIGLAGYTTLVTAWSLFSGTTGYVSLATAAFYGIGAYVVAVLNEQMAFGMVLAVAGLVGCLVASLVGLATLRLSGVYFVIFSFGLAELIRQLITWYDVKYTGALGRYIFVDITSQQIYWLLLGLLVITTAVRWWLGRSRAGLALSAMAEDEAMARHMGVPVVRVKLMLFIFSALVMTLVGAIQSPRYTYVEPSIVFNPIVSFLTLIMALTGGPRYLWGPILGAVPLFLLFEWLSIHFPSQYALILGSIFVVIVWVLRDGVAGLVLRLGALMRSPAVAPKTEQGK